MTSRLDRLFILLETGTNSVTKRAAAQQLGEAQRLHPHELHHLLARVSTLLKSTQWDTRISAAHAVQAIVSQVPVWDPVPIKKECKSGLEEESIRKKNNHRLSLDNFDMTHVLAQSSCLTGSEGSEYDLVVTDGEIVSAQDEKVFAEKIGLYPHLIGVHTNELITSDDLIHDKSSIYKKEHRKMSIEETLKQTIGLSRREMNRARRKARQSISKQRSRESDDIADVGSSNIIYQNLEPLVKRVKVEDGSLGAWYNSSSIAVIDSRCAVPDGTGCWPESAVDWPFEAFAENLLQDLFSMKWEIRHGAATALREFIKLHGRESSQPLSSDYELSQKSKVIHMETKIEILNLHRQHPMLVWKLYTLKANGGLSLAGTDELIRWKIDIVNVA